MSARSAAAGLLAVGVLVAVFWNSVEWSSPPKPLVAAPVDVSGTATIARTAADYEAALRDLARLAVAPEDTGVHYRREDWRHWIGQPQFGRGCDTRKMVLIEQGEHASPAGAGPVERDPATCEPVAGDGDNWVSPYDDAVVTDPSALDVDHVVPLEEMARSGTRGWTPDQRERYANDPEVLIAVTASTNRAKGSKDPARWMPPNAAYGCEYVRRWVEVKVKYSSAGALTVDPAEHDALNGRLRICAAGAPR